MVKLKEIKRNSADITCVAFVEDCEEPIGMVLHTEDGSFYSDPLPNGYEWCTAHIQHAKINLKKMLESGDMPEQRTIMWC